MRFSAFVVAGLGMVAAAQAQTNPAPLHYLPVPDALPAMFAGSGDFSNAVELNYSIRTAVELPAASRPVVSAAPPVADAPLKPTTTDAVPAVGAPVQVISPEPPPAVQAALPPPEPVAPPEKPMGSVTVIVEGIQAQSGTVNVGVCNKSLSREGCPYNTEVKAVGPFVEAKFDNIPPGRYAVVGYHDVNGNSELDKMFGVPREPFALSAKAANAMVPTFDDAAVNVSKGDNVFVIKLRGVLR